MNMDLDVTILNPVVELKPTPGSEDYIAIDLGLITVRNERDKLKRRILEAGSSGITETYVDSYKIKMSRMAFRIVTGGQHINISQEFDFNLWVEMAAMDTHYKFLFPDLKIDPTIRVKIFISPILLRMQHSDYLLIMKCLFHNVA